LRAVVAQFKPDVVISNSLHASEAVRLLKHPMRLEYMRMPYGFSPKGPLKDWFDAKIVLAGFDGHLANSQWTADRCAALVPGARVAVAHPLSGVTDEVLSRPREPAVAGQLRMLTLSRFTHEKGLDVALEALQALQDNADTRDRVTLTMAGGGVIANDAYSEKLLELGRALGDQVTFLGHQSDVWSMLLSHDVILCPSTVPEPYGQVVAQGLATGCVPIVSAQGGAVEQIVPGVTGLATVPGDSEDLARAIASLLADPDQLHTLGQAGRQVAAARTDAHFAAELESSIELLGAAL
jgi:glycosyltransferase involved in cell wall biosynthesis